MDNILQLSYQITGDSVLIFVETKRETIEMNLSINLTFFLHDWILPFDCCIIGIIINKGIKGQILTISDNKMIVLQVG